MTQYYIPGDPTSSPYEPMIAATVLYRPHKNVALGRDIAPAIVTRVYDDDRVDLTVFTGSGVYHVTKVPYNESPDSDNCWFWQKERVERIEKPIDNKSDTPCEESASAEAAEMESAVS